MLESLRAENVRNQQSSITIRSDRKNHQVDLDDVYYIESLNDYVKVVMKTGELTTREKITNLSESLPSHFVRIHRSFIVNSNHVQSFTNTEVVICNKLLPISRTFKIEALAHLEK